MAAAEMNPPSASLPMPRNEEVPSLLKRINISTRSTHTQLNRLVLARLPVALPPHTSDPSIYASGLLYIAPIYITFESLWQNLISPDLSAKLHAGQKHDSCDEDILPKALSTDSLSFLSAHPPKLCHKIHFILSQLLLPGLLRSERLRSDIKLLSGKSSQEIDEQLSHISQHAPALSKFIEHIEHSVVAKPHVLVAYAWVLYMALFSGGRYLRASLQKVGTDFWLQSQSAAQSAQDVLNPSPTRQETALSDMHDHKPHHLKGLMVKSKNCAQEEATTPTLHRFFHFPGVEDGEDIKKEFKERVAEVDILLSDGEKDEIIKEAQHIFNFMIGIVGDLDTVCNTSIGQGKREKH